MYNVPEGAFPNWRQSFRQFFRSRSALSILILLNVGVWITLTVTDLAVFLSTLLFNGGLRLKPLFYEYLGYPANFRTTLIHPWSVVTSLFLHHNFWQLLFNVLVLWLAGSIYSQYKSGKSLLVHYLVGGVCGNLVFQLAYNIFPAFHHISTHAYCFSSSAAVLAVLLAVTLYQPNHPVRMLFFKTIRLKWVALILIGLMVIPSLDSDLKHVGEYFCYMGGAMYGAAVGVCLSKGKKWFAPKAKQKKQKYYTSYQAAADAQQSAPSTPSTSAQDNNDEKRVEEILAKIAKDGYGALTKEEKDFLYHYKKH